jgi:hypothetical protein
MALIDSDHARGCCLNNFIFAPIVSFRTETYNNEDKNSGIAGLSRAHRTSSVSIW